MNSDGKPASPSSTSPLPVVTTGNPTGQDPSRQQFQAFEVRTAHFRGQHSPSFGVWTQRGQHFPAFEVRTPQFTGRGNLGQSQGIGSIQQSNMLHGPFLSSDPGLLTGRGNMNAQVSRPYFRPCRKRVAFQPMVSSIPQQRRRTLPTQPFIPPSIPTTTRSAPSVSNTAQRFPHLAHTSPSFTHLANRSFIPPFIPRSIRSALSVPTIPQTIHPLNYATPSRPHQPQTSQSLPHSRQRAVVDEKTDGTLEPIGYNCFSCKRDLSYPTEGPISQSTVPPRTAVLACGHTFHDFCLKRMTSDEQSADPPCIACDLGE